MQPQQQLSYNPATGHFTWLINKGRTAKQGQRAGYVRKDGYVTIMVRGRAILAHVLAWFFQTGNWPDFEIDHRDLDNGNNQWTNLRPATCSQNAANRRKRSDSKNAYKGISRKGNKWRANVTVDGHRQYLGYFDTPEAAHAAYVAAASRVHGEFARAA